jgi:ribosomal protein L4
MYHVCRTTSLDLTRTVLLLMICDCLVMSAFAQPRQAMQPTTASELASTTAAGQEMPWPRRVQSGAGNRGAAVFRGGGRMGH